MLHSLFKSMIDQDRAPVVLCDLSSVIVYMNPAAIAMYHGDLTGTDLGKCHNAESNRKIERVLAWFGESAENNCIHTVYSQARQTDIYMVALRDENGVLIGYYEKHESRVKDDTPFYAYTEQNGSAQ